MQKEDEKESGEWEVGPNSLFFSRFADAMLRVETRKNKNGEGQSEKVGKWEHSQQEGPRDPRAASWLYAKEACFNHLAA